MMFDDNRPLTCWEEDDIDVQICLAPILVCSEAVQTAGGGDNISAAGLVVQIPCECEQIGTITFNFD